MDDENALLNDLKQAARNGTPLSDLLKMIADYQDETKELPPPNVTITPPEKSPLLLDQVSNELFYHFGDYREVFENGEAIALQSNGRDRNAEIVLALEYKPPEEQKQEENKERFDELHEALAELRESQEIHMPDLTPFDDLVATAVYAIFLAGNRYFTATQVHFAMGNTTRPAINQLERIRQSVKKMSRLKLTIDNSGELRANRKYVKFQEERYIINCESIKAFVDGKFCEEVFEIVKIPPILQFAQERKHLTMVPVKALETTVNRSDLNIRIQNYLLRRIAHMKRDKNAPRKILFNTLYNNCNIKTPYEKARARERAETMLSRMDELRKEWEIESFKVQKDGIVIAFKKPGK